MLQRLRDKAISAYSQFSGHNITPPPTADKTAESEMEIFAGYTRVVETCAWITDQNAN